MRNRLIELFKESYEINAVDNGEFIETTVNWEEIADCLLENGVMVPPVNIGDIVYKIYCYEILEVVVTNVIMGLNPSKCKVYTEDKLMLLKQVWYQDSFGEQLFFTKEEAERVLEELKNGTR